MYHNVASKDHELLISLVWILVKLTILCFIKFMNPLYIVALDMGLWKDHVTIDLPHVLSDLLPYFGTEN